MSNPPVSVSYASTGNGTQPVNAVSSLQQLEPSPQLGARATTPTQSGRQAWPPLERQSSKVSYAESSVSSTNDPLRLVTSARSASLRPPSITGRSPTAGGRSPAPSTYQAPVGVSSTYAPARYPQGIPPSPTGAPSRFYLLSRHSTSTSISTTSAMPTPYVDSIAGAKAFSGSFFPQSDYTVTAEQLSRTMPITEVRPITDNLDTIWSDLAIMDDIEDLAGRVGQSGNFFGTRHTEALQQLQQAQIELAFTMKEGENVIDLVADEGKLWEITDNDISFAKSSKIFNEEHFEHVQQIVDNVMTKLDGVVDSMKVLEGQSRSLWNEKPDENWDRGSVLS
ncbi:hypothetical protein V1512DRAFT_138060 [Lipomyces arxii]|uniref:uncharacterized protein n=1 Tax=Lipomyces arxii TaxID=56418 RepID=UPI0034CE68AD